MAGTIRTLYKMAGSSFLGACMDAIGRDGSPAQVRIGTRSYYAVGHPDQARQILVDNFDNWRRTYTYEARQPSLGRNLLSTDGPEWREKRSLIQPAFRRSRIDLFVATMADCVGDLLNRWERFRPGQVFDLVPEMQMLGLDIICRCTLGSKHPISLERLARIFDVIQFYFRRASFVPERLHRRLPLKLSREYAAAKMELDASIFDFIDRRRQEPGNDILSSLLDLRYDSGEEMGRQELRDSVMTLLHAGHETVMLAFAWTLYLLGRHAPVREKLERAIDETLGGRQPGIEDLRALRYAEMVIKESMRLYPPVPAMSRTNLEDERIGNMLLPGGSFVSIMIWYLHMHPEYWPRPEVFDPERFSRRCSTSGFEHAYLPFAAGGHRCIGHHFAMLATSIAVIMIVQRYRLEPTSKATPIARVSLRPRKGMPVAIQPLSAPTPFPAPSRRATVL